MMSALFLVGVAIVVLGIAAIKWGLDLMRTARQEARGATQQEQQQWQNPYGPGPNY